jgi:hypothetical protein
MKYQEQSLVLGEGQVGEVTTDDAVSVSLSSGSNGTNPYALTAKEILQRINKELKDELPEGIESLDPADHTPEATADRIVSGVTAFFDVFARQNKELQGDELVDAFIETIKRGVQKGYDDAYQILEAVGAFDVEGVREGVQQTKILIESKLNVFAEERKKALSGQSVQ